VFSKKVLLTSARTPGLIFGAQGVGGGEITPGFGERFGSAFDTEVQRWVKAARRGELDGPTAWDGYATAACCEAGVAALRSGKKVDVSLKKKPSIYC
jgi:myo-inositol 2-dehydrogenase/D-chiro-inositol 1-dehydrogenase